MKDAVKSISKGAFFSEFFLMSIATLGAFFIKEYSEGVAVMLFYAVGELFQTAAVNRAKRSIKALLDIRGYDSSISENVYGGLSAKLRNRETVSLDIAVVE